MVPLTATTTRVSKMMLKCIKVNLLTPQHDDILHFDYSLPFPHFVLHVWRKQASVYSIYSSRGRRQTSFSLHQQLAGKHPLKHERVASVDHKLHYMTLI